MKNQFLQLYPQAIITEKKVNGDVIVYVNGQTAFNKSDVYNASNWLLMMKNAYLRALPR